MLNSCYSDKKIRHAIVFSPNFDEQITPLSILSKNKQRYTQNEHLFIINYHQN